MEILALWSGGLDSTFMLKMLSEAGHRVRAGYVEFINNEAKTKRELGAIDRLIDAGFTRQYDIDYLGVIHRVDLIKPRLNFGLCMPISLIHGLATRVDEHTDRIAMGYVMGDDAISFFEDFQSIYKSFHPLMRYTPELIFPLTKYKKGMIWDELVGSYRKLVTWCESSDDEDHCGHCVPCRRMEFERIPHQSTMNVEEPPSSKGDFFRQR